MNLAQIVALAHKNASKIPGPIVQNTSRIWSYDMRDDCTTRTDKVILYIVRYGLWFYVAATAFVVLAV